MRLLGGGIAALSASLVLPRLSFASSGDAIRALAFDGATAIAAKSSGLWRLHGGEAQALSLADPVTCLASHPAWEEMLFAALEGDGLWRSQDAGGSWEFVMDRPYLEGAEHEVLSPVSVASPTGKGGIWLYAATEAGLTRVPDCLCRWQDEPLGDAMDALASGTTPAPAAPLPAGEPATTLALAPEAPERLYAGLTSCLWASSDAGVSWSLISAGAIEALAVNPADPPALSPPAKAACPSAVMAV